MEALSFTALDRSDLVMGNLRALEIFSTPLIPRGQIPLSTRC